MRRLQLFALLALALAAPLAAAQWGFWDYGPGAFGDQAWKEPVANAAALPATGNETGDVRVTLDDLAMHVWDGDSWETSSSGGGTGTVTSVALAVPAEWTVSGSPVTTSGTITISEATQTANTVYAGPTTGAAAAPGFRALVSADIPNNAADTSGNAATATALAANPADCAANQFANAIAASGDLTCSALADADVPDGITVTLAGTATALAANGANCSAGQYPLGVDASGAAESCTADDDTPDSDSEVPDNITVTGSVSPSAFTFPASASPSQTTDAQAVWDSDDNRLTVGDGAATAIIYPGAHAGAVTDGGAATTATALAANGANCSAGQYPLGVDASGAVESCTADSTTPASDAVTEAMLKAVDTASDEECLTYESTVGDFEWQACGSGIGGSTGATDLGILIANGTGGSTAQASAATLTTAGSLTIPSGQKISLGGTTASDAGIVESGVTAGDLAAINGDGSDYTNVRAKAYRYQGNNNPSLGSDGLRLNVGTYIQWFATDGSASNDTAIVRHDAAVVRISDGTVGIGALISSVLIEANTAGSGAPNALAATESGTVLTNEGATAKNYHSLPAAVAPPTGYQFIFVVPDADGLRVTAAAGDIIHIAGGGTSTAGGYCESTTQWSRLDLVSINATDWSGLAGGTWTCDGS